MRIAIYHDLPSGGAKRTLYETVKRLSERGHSLDVYTLSTANKDFCNISRYLDAEYEFEFLPSKLLPSPLGRLNQLTRWWDLQRLNRLARQIASRIDAKKYDVVFAQPCMWTQAPLILRYLRTPSVYYCHELPRHLYEKSGNRSFVRSWREIFNALDPLIWLYRSTARRIDRTAACCATRVLVNSSFIQKQSQDKYGVDSIICYHGVDTDDFSPRSDSKQLDYILSVGAIQSHKGYDFLIESLKYIDAGLRPPLHLIGNTKTTSYHEALQVMAQERGVDLHIVVGVDQFELVRKYNEAVLVVYAPYNEPFGLVPLEAMACGKPVVGVREGGVKETVKDGYTGTLVDRDPQAFGAAIQTLLENPTLTSTYSENSRKYALEHWSWDKSVSDLEGHLGAVARK